MTCCGTSNVVSVVELPIVERDSIPKRPACDISIFSIPKCILVVSEVLISLGDNDCICRLKLKRPSELFSNHDGQSVQLRQHSQTYLLLLQHLKNWLRANADASNIGPLLVSWLVPQKKSYLGGLIVGWEEEKVRSAIFLPYSKNFCFLLSLKTMFTADGNCGYPSSAVLETINFEPKTLTMLFPKQRAFSNILPALVEQYLVFLTVTALYGANWLRLES